MLGLRAGDWTGLVSGLLELEILTLLIIAETN